jgi:plasmid stabilization system protein ParE
MTFTVRELPRATRDKRRIFEWLFERSPQGAAAWLDAYDQMIERLTTAAESFPAAHENQDIELEVKQVLFKTKRGRIYRAVFHVDGVDVFILRVRGPGQAPITKDEFAS